MLKLVEQVHVARPAERINLRGFHIVPRGTAGNARKRSPGHTSSLGKLRHSWPLAPARAGERPHNEWRERVELFQKAAFESGHI